MDKQLSIKQSPRRRVIAVAAVLLLMSLACGEAQDDSLASSDVTEALSGDTQSQDSEDAEVLTDGTPALSVDAEASEEYIQWVLEDPAAQFVGLSDPIPGPFFQHDDAMYGFLWIEYPCVYLRDPEPLPLDIQSIVDLDLDLEEAVGDMASWYPPIDPQLVYESEPAHRMLLRFPRQPSTSYDRATGQLRLGKWGPMSSGDFVKLGTRIEDFNSEYRSHGCDAYAQVRTGYLNPSRKHIGLYYRKWR